MYSGILKVIFEIHSFILYAYYKVVVYHHQMTKTLMMVNTVLMVQAGESFSFCLCLLAVGGVGKRVLENVLEKYQNFIHRSGLGPIKDTGGT